MEEAVMCGVQVAASFRWLPANRHGMLLDQQTNLL